MLLSALHGCADPANGPDNEVGKWHDANPDVSRTRSSHVRNDPAYIP